MSRHGVESRGTKQCSNCRERKPLREFHVERRAADGHRRQCKTCIQAKSLGYYHAVGRARRREPDELAPLAAGACCPIHGITLLYGTSGRGAAVEYCPRCGERPIPVRRSA